MTQMTNAETAAQPQAHRLEASLNASKPGLGRTVLSGIAGGVLFSLATFVTFVLIGSGLDRRSGPLFDPSWQSDKLIAVLTRIEPLPLFDTKPALVLLAYVLFAVGHALLYRSVAAAWPRGILARTWRLAALTWGLSYLFFELLGPFNLLGEPLALVALELVFWAMAALIEAAAIVTIVERQQRLPTIA